LIDINQPPAGKPPENPSGKSGLVSLFASHPVAGNLLMLLMILSGFWGLKHLNTQFFPDYDLDTITIQVPWRGASAEDVEVSITIPIEQDLKDVNYIKKVVSTSSQGSSFISLEIDSGTDIGLVLDEVKQRVDSIRNLPAEAEDPVVQMQTRYETIADIVLTAPGNLSELRVVARNLEQQLLDRGIRRIQFFGLPEEEIAIQVKAEQLHNLGMTLGEIATTVRQHSIDLPAGIAGKKDSSRQIRSLGQQRTASGFEQIPVISDDNGQLVRLGDIASIERRARDNEPYLTHKGQPAIKMRLQRTTVDDTLKSAKIMQNWLADVRPTLPPNIEITVVHNSWRYVQDRINLLLKNGLGGLILVVGILYLFLTARVAFWVTVGIPVSFLATLAMLYLLGESINVISLFGLIMTLGIIVDDAIVVGEDATTHFNRGEPGLQAAIGGAHRMLPLVMASSLTTICAFFPLLLIDGRFGQLMLAIPIVAICVIVASLVECFLILPGHLRSSLHHRDDAKESPLRKKFDDKFAHFRDHTFRNWIIWVINNRAIVLACAAAFFIISFSLLKGGQIKFTFFPTIDSPRISANVQFNTGINEDEINQFLAYLEKSVYETEQEIGEAIIHNVNIYHRQALFPGSPKGEQYGSVDFELSEADQRKTTNATFIGHLKNKVQLPAGVERFTLSQSRAGPPGSQIEIKLTGATVDQLKAASIELQEAIKGFNGTHNVDDDLPYSKGQLIYKLTPTGEALGLTLEAVGEQLRSAFDGRLIQIFHEQNAEVEVRVLLPDTERNYLNIIDRMPVILPDRSTVPLSNVVTFTAKKGIDTLKHLNGQLSVVVTGDVDESTTNANEILAALKVTTLPALQSKYGLAVSFEGRAADQAETLGDMLLGAFLALLLIYIILAWVFASYSWPLAVMLAIPLGISGAFVGHYIMGIDLTILSLFGCFGLSGIVINDSIVLVTFYKNIRAQGMGMLDAVVEAACQRLRAVLLTSLTTIAGLTPILFETSLQAQFLIPMVTAIVFGLAFGTLLILLVVPCLLISVEHIKAFFNAGERTTQTLTG
jgi:multidrug efflux pump subunit AcrB